jgi:hypothetical protein
MHVPDFSLVVLILPADTNPVSSPDQNRPDKVDKKN